MVGLFNIGLGPGRPYMQPDSLTFTGAAYWLGGVVMSQCSVNISGCYVPLNQWNDQNFLEFKLFDERKIS